MGKKVPQVLSKVLGDSNVERKYTKDWRPKALRPWFLISIIAISGGLIAVLQYLVIESQRNNGIIFAEDLTTLPLSSSFPYLYLPTIIAVLYGFAWTWIDLDVRRCEPFFQLAKEGGAPAEESILLSYPVDFIASVPLKALRYRHWSPFVASFATVVVFWGLTPSQAGIFATSTVNRTVTMPMAYSSSHLSLDQQAGSLSARSANSVSNILWLNETLQPFMTQDAMLAPFGPVDEAAESTRGTWSGDTWQYFANVSCEDAIVWNNDGFYFLNSTWGCSTSAPSLRSRSVLDDTTDTKVYDTLYVGYYNIDGNAAYYLGNGRCPRNQTNSFMVQWSKALVMPSTFLNMSNTEQRDNADVTTLYCRSSYFAQKVHAKVQLPNRNVIHVEPRGEPEPLVQSLFNGSAFEASMSEGRDRFRTEFPSLEWPDQTSYLKDSDLYLGFMSRMVPFAVGANKLPMADYLAPDTLANSYQAAYRLLFARQMADVLLSELDPSTAADGQSIVETQAVIVVPTFAYIVEALLGSACLFAAGILGLSCRRRTKLWSDPASLASIMSLAADNEVLLDVLRQLDTSTTDELEATIRTMSFQLETANDRTEPGRLMSMDLRGDQNGSTQQSPGYQTRTRSMPEGNCDKLPAIQPVELSVTIGTVFFSCLLTVFILLGVLYFQIQRHDGLALPTQDRFVRQLLENYIPTGIATLIEPFWLLLNRNLCYLQPFEALRKRPQSAQRTIGLDYLSLPPQLVAIKAIFGRHFLLALVCLMTLLANVLSVSLSGLFFEDDVLQPLRTTFAQSMAFRFRPIDGSSPPLMATTGDNVGPFYIASSNATANTPLPAWSDANYFYQPFIPTDEKDTSPGPTRATTQAVGAQVDCQPLAEGSEFSVTGTAFDDSGTANIPSHSNLTVMLRNGESTVMCVPRDQLVNGFSVNPETLFSVPTGNCSFEFAYALQGMNGSSIGDNRFCNEHLAAGWVHGTLMNGTKLPGTEHTTTQPSVVLSYEPFVMVCKTKIVAGTAEVTISEGGHVLQVDQVKVAEATPSMFESSAADVISQAHYSILRTGREWHNDSNPSDFVNYLIAKATNSNVLLDPNAALPSIDSASAAFSGVYSKLFAIWLQQNRVQLFESNQNETLNGVLLERQTRIFMSKTMFVLSEVILALYMVVTVALYTNRPWKVLCRMPTSLASIIAYAAASRAIQDLRATVTLDRRGLLNHLDAVGSRYGFGSYIGVDKVAHVGIEKEPFVVKLSRAEAISSSSAHIYHESKKNTSRQRTRLQYWNSGNVREGGWL